MFEVGDYISYGSIGICKVEGITAIEMPDTGKRDSYILKPVYDSKRTVYCPVDNTKVHMRRKISKEESEALLQKIPELEVFENKNRKLFEARCKEAVMSGDCLEWSKLIKTMFYDKQMRHKQGRRMTSMNEKFLHDAEDKLYGELAISLHKERAQIAEIMEEIIMK